MEQSQLPSGWQRGSPTSPGGQVPNSISRKSVRARSLQREHGLQPAGGPFGCSISSFLQGSTPGKQLPHGQLPFSHGAPGTQPVQLPVHLISTHGPGSVCCPAVCAGSTRGSLPQAAARARARTHTHHFGCQSTVCRTIARGFSGTHRMARCVVPGAWLRDDRQRARRLLRQHHQRCDGGGPQDELCAN